MASMTVDCGSFNKTSYSGVTQYGSLVNFYIPDGATITGCSVSFTTHASGGDTADRAFSLNGARAHSGWASAGSLNAGLLRGGNNTFRVTLKSQTPSGSGGTSCIWNISGITLTITYNESGGGYSPPVGGGGPVSISPSSIDAGAGSITVTCPAEAGIWHLVNWSFGTKSGQWSHYWETGGTGTIDIPLSWIEEIPNAAQGTLNIRVRRSTTPAEPYSYASDQTTAVTIKVPADVVPTISAFTETLDANGVPGTISGYVQGKSRVSLAVSAAAGSYSSLSSVRITGGGIDVYASSGTFGPFNYSGDIIFTATAVDTRGRSASRQVAISVMPYSAPAFSTPEAWRSNYDGVKNQKGTYVRLKSGASFSSLDGQNAVTLKGRVYLKGGAVSAWENMTAGTDLILGGGALLYTRTYIAQMQVSDLLETRTIEFIIPTKKTGLSILAGMQGAAIGKPAETPGIFESAWPIVAPGIPPNPNLLHGWDFRNPVNQRGVSGSVPIGYFLDRWKNEAGACTVNSGYIIVGNPSLYEYSWISQTIENDMAGLTCTFSMVDTLGNLYKCTSTFPTSRDTYNTQQIAGDGSIQFKTDAGVTCSVRIIRGESLAIQFVKLELGTVSTLHLDPPMDHAVELLKCQRFYRPLPIGSGRLFNATNSQIELAYELNPPMRIKPTAIIPSLTNAVFVQNVNYYTPTSYDIWSSSTKDLAVVRMFGSFPEINNLISLTTSGAALSADL